MYLGMANPPVGSFGCTAGRRGMPGGAPGPGMPARWRHRPAPPPGLPARPRDPVLAMPDALTVARTAGPSIRAQHGPQAPGHGFPARIPGTDAGQRTLMPAVVTGPMLAPTEPPGFPAR